MMAETFTKEFPRKLPSMYKVVKDFIIHVLGVVYHVLGGHRFADVLCVLFASNVSRKFSCLSHTTEKENAEETNMNRKPSICFKFFRAGKKF